MADVPTGTVTFLFSDIEGSTRLLAKLRDRYPDVLEAQQTILRSAFSDQGGHEIDSQGDSFFVAFGRARDAVAAAIAAQRTLAAHAWPEDVDLKVRIGIHTGEPIPGGDRYVGLGVNRAARIMAAAKGGQVLISNTTRELVEDDLPDGVRLRDLGEHRLKDLDRPERVFQLVAGDLPDSLAPAAVGRAPPDLEFRMLGPVEALRGGDPIPVGGEKPRAVLALLLLDAGHVVSTDRLVDALWGARPPRTAATSLQNFVSQLRKLLGVDVLLTKPPGYVLQVDAEQLDLGRFERLVREARDEHDPEDRARRLREALALWRGSPLADFAFEAFAQPEILRLEELRLSVLEDRLDADLEAGRHADHVGEIEALVAEHPLRERLRGHLMLALYRSGRQAEALDAYQQARAILVRELGIEPSPALQELHRSILRQDSLLDRSTEASTPDDHFDEIVAALTSGRLIPVIGTEVTELAARLAERFGYVANGATELPRVSQYVSIMKGAGPLYDELHDLLDVEGAPGPLHRLLAALPASLRANGLPHQLIVTTGYDLALERAFAEAGEEFDVVSYVAAGRHRGKFCHVDPAGRATIVDIPNTYATELSLEVRTVILKLHGQVDRTPEREWESFVVTEDDYIEYLSSSELVGAVPVGLAARLRRSHFLFLGYGMRDWNRRVILNRLWGDQAVSYTSWAVHPDATPLDRAFWRSRGIDAVDLPLDDYADTLGRRLAGLGLVGASA